MRQAQISWLVDRYKIDINTATKILNRFHLNIYSFTNIEEFLVGYALKKLKHRSLIWYFI